MPTPSEWFDNVALRDLALHEQHAACVDARGDVYQWGDGFFGSEPGTSRTKPRVTLRGKVGGMGYGLIICSSHVRRRTSPSCS